MPDIYPYLEQALSHLQTHFYYVLLGAGLLIMIGAIRDWAWATDFSAWKMRITREFIAETNGREGLHQFERWMSFAAGMLLTISGGIYYWYLG
ncbi:hypothetical protein [Boudabousia marimammalium]|uniref:Uncharacterized protein n=1 Tax=Boudabousia marimammalium TaxID=156892 RepID=A0A1Q5PJ76_9ACTO|nr:hypothetical protein [Boudabousia marimammalium]OKL45902.1 hypothetical protein BM477_07810 [Boudabousia marimammalium]